ncbi:hypothetical protein FOMPIDRAFT_1050925 [Fomitopsis schrenkii]|uniref:Uncharacterized protein n=1 Tax=Fomitopsis schrenkii TaxID=2126942 RepID=S8E229_FOMSC|nr:hypothetical protein FOMPIDRAFT_1050925 [Fomitopsis schrenkii]
MAILEALEQHASSYLKETRQLIWKYVNQHLSMTAAGSTDGEGSDGYDPFLELQPTQEVDLPGVNIESVVAGPSASKPPLSRPASSAIAGQSSKAAQRLATLAPTSASKAGKKKRGPAVAEDEEPEEQEQG